MQRGLLDDHIPKCPVYCKFGCNQKVSPKLMAQHETECPEKQVECTAKDIGCNWTGKRSQVGHHALNCNMIILKPALQEINILKGDLK